MTRLGDFLTLSNFLRPSATINLPKSSTFLGNICKGVKIIHFSCEIILGQLCIDIWQFLSGHTTRVSLYGCQYLKIWTMSTTLQVHHQRLTLRPLLLRSMIRWYHKALPKRQILEHALDRNSLPKLVRENSSLKTFC